MPDTTFESLLTAQLREYAEAGVRPIDRYAIAEGTIAGGRRGGLGWRWSFGQHRRPLMLVVVGLLVLALAASAALVGSRLLQPSTGVFEGVMVPVPDMAFARTQPVLVTLADGRVLVVGGRDQQNYDVPTAEIFDPGTRSFTPIAGWAPSGHGAGILLHDGRTLILLHDENHIASSVTVFDPRTMAFTLIDDVPVVSGSPLAPVGPVALEKYALSTLHDGRVLISGGMATYMTETSSDVLTVASAAIFDPRTNTFSQTGPMLQPRQGHSMTTLADGRVLVVGGERMAPYTAAEGIVGDPERLQDAEIYDPATGTFSFAGRTSALTGANTGLLLPDGRVLLVTADDLRTTGGAWSSDPSPAEIYDPSKAAFSKAASPSHHVADAVLLRDGTVFLTGQYVAKVNEDPIAWSGIYDPGTGATRMVDAPRATFERPVALADGRILLAGGYDYNPTAGYDFYSDGWVPWAEILR
jgi:hypothetical protein